MILAGSYSNGFAPRDGQPLYPELWRGCVGAWSPCLGPTGLVLRDWSGFANHGVLTNGASFVIDVGASAIRFDGANDYVSLPRSVTNERLNGKLDCTGSVWFRGANIDSVIRLQPTGGQYIVLGNSNTLISHLDGGLSGVTIPAAATNGLLHHLLFRRVANSSTGLELWMDGNLVGSRSTVSTALTFTGLDNGVNFGAYTNPTVFSPTNGNAYDFRIYDRALNINEIKTLASRRGIAYEMAPVRYAGESLAAYTRRLQHAQLIGGGLIG